VSGETGAPANSWRGEASLVIDGIQRRLRPSFAALVAAEDELGSLVALVERAGAGELRLREMAALFWHCLVEREEMTREKMGEALTHIGIAEASKRLRTILTQILQGAG
jgi:hypothetical protein